MFKPNPGYIIRATVYGSVAGCPLLFNVLLRENGKLKPMQINFSQSSALSIEETAELELYNEEIVSMSIEINSVSFATQSLRASINLGRKAGNNFYNYSTLASGFVSNYLPLCWPVASGSAAAPPASTLQKVAWPDIGDNKRDITVPDNEFFIIRSAGLRYIADATAVNRQARLYITDGTSYYNSLLSATLQTASSTRYWTWGQYFGAGEVENGVRVTLPLPFPYVPAGQRFGAYFENEQAGDSTDGAYLILERYPAP